QAVASNAAAGTGAAGGSVMRDVTGANRQGSWNGTAEASAPESAPQAVPAIAPGATGTGRAARAADGLVLGDPAIADINRRENVRPCAPLAAAATAPCAAGTGSTARAADGIILRDGGSADRQDAAGAVVAGAAKANAHRS